MRVSFDYNITIGGEAGQGMQTLGLLLSKSLLRTGYYISTLQSYQSRIRGGHNFFQIRISSKPVHSMTSQIDILIALDKATLTEHCEFLTADSVIVYNKDKIKVESLCASALGIAISELYPGAAKVEIVANSVYLGVLTGLLNLPTKPIEELFESTLKKKGEEVIRQNKEALQAGLRFVQVDDTWKGKYPTQAPEITKPFMFIHGNQAIALGAIAGGCKFYSAYPMTPSTSVFETVANHMNESGIVVEQAEDEIAALNMVLGAAYSGVRAMTGTSGGGLALMVEGISLAGITETPAVIVNAQRPGPATGLPTRTEQADLEFCIYAGHGEFPKVVLCPGNHKDCFDLTIEAFNIAEEFQVPVIILTDQYLADWYSNVTPFDITNISIRRGKWTETSSDYKRYQITEDGISPRAFPGKGPGVVIADSDEHTEDGHLTEDLEIRVKMNNKRLQKYESLRKKAIKPEIIGQGDDIGIICWGSSLGPCQDVVNALEQENYKVSLIHFKQVWPLDETGISSLLAGYKDLICIEGNATGQFSRVLRSLTSICIKKQILKFDGKPFIFDDLLASTKNLLSKNE